MKRRISWLLALTLALSLGACGQTQTTADPAPTAVTTPGRTDTPAPIATDVPVIYINAPVSVEISRTSETVMDDTDSDVLLRYSADRPQISLPDNTAAAERINAALLEDYRFFTEGEANMEGPVGKAAFADAAREEYRMRCTDGTKDAFYPYQLERTVDVTRGDDRVLSLTYLDATYLGGAHGYAGLSAVDYDLRTGEKLRLEDLSDDPAAFLEQCADWLWEDSRSGEHTALALGGYFPDYEEALPGLLRDGNWYFADEGIVVIANPYEIAPYASGRIEFTLPYDWLCWQIRDEYLPTARKGSGSLTGEIRDTAGAADYLVDDGTNGQGACVLFTAHGPVEDISLVRVEYLEYSNSFLDDGTLWYASHLNDGKTLQLRTWIGDVLPTLKIRWKQSDGKQEEYLISQSGRDGSLVLLDTAPLTCLPVEISRRLPFEYDVDGDGETETVDLVNTGLNGGTHWLLSVDGQLAGDAFAMDAELMSLYLADLDADGVAEILFSGDMGSDDYITCAWRGDTLEVIPFTGEARREQDPQERTNAADGRVVFSDLQLYLESWSYQLGTYAAVRAYTYEGGVIAPADNPWSDPSCWSYPRNRTWLTVTKPVPAVWPDGGETPLEAGTEILLGGTDGNTAFFTTRDGRTGAIRLEFRHDADGYFAGWTIDGVPEDDCFQMLPYAG